MTQDHAPTAPTFPSLEAWQAFTFWGKLKNLFSGRLSRLHFVLVTFISFFIYIGLIALLMIPLISLEELGIPIGVTVGAIALTVLLFVTHNISIYVRRLHDFGLPGSKVVYLMLLKVIGLGVLVWIFLAFWKGTEGDNTYGPQYQHAHSLHALANRPKTLTQSTNRVDLTVGVLLATAMLAGITAIVLLPAPTETQSTVDTQTATSTILTDGVIMYIPLSDGTNGTEHERNAIAELETTLEESLASSTIGIYDGNEIGEGFYTLYMYGEDAEALYAQVFPIIIASPYSTNATVFKEFCDVTFKNCEAERVDL